MTFKRAQTQFCVQGAISLQSMYERATAHLRACMRALCDLIIVKIFLGLHPDISMRSLCSMIRTASDAGITDA